MLVSGCPGESRSCPGTCVTRSVSRVRAHRGTNTSRGPPGGASSLQGPPGAFRGLQTTTRNRFLWGVQDKHICCNWGARTPAKGPLKVAENVGGILVEVLGYKGKINVVAGSRAVFCDVREEPGEALYVHSP